MSGFHPEQTSRTSAFGLPLSLPTGNAEADERGSKHQ